MYHTVLENVPATLKGRKQWTCWRFEQRDRKRSKLPFQPNGSPSKANDRSTWCSYDEAFEALQSGSFDGLGYFFSQEDPFVGIDLDNCLSETGEVAEWAQPFLELGSYAETSPSGCGIKIIFEGKSPYDRGRRIKLREPGACLEVYDHARYFALTGDVFGDLREIREIEPKHLQQLLDELPIESPRRENSQTSSTSNDDTRQSDRVARCVAYLSKVPDAVSGEGGHDRTFSAVCVCVRFGLSLDETHHVMAWFNEHKCQPPWSQGDLAKKIRDGYERAMADGEFGRKLTEDRQQQPDYDIDLSAIIGGSTDRSSFDDPPPRADAGKPFPPHLLEVPGFIGEFVRYCNDTCFKVQPVLSLAAGICLQAVLAGRKVVDIFATRPNVYALGVAGSGRGKEHGRDVINRLLEAIDGQNLGGLENPRSGAALISGMIYHPAKLALVDEFGRFLAFNRQNSGTSWSRDIVDNLLKLYSAGGGLWRGAQYADSKLNVEINRPCLSVYGTTVPTSLYANLERDNLTDGLLGRVLIFRGHEQPKLGPCDPGRAFPQSMLDHATAWHEGRFLHGADEGNLVDVADFDEKLVPHDADAERAARTILAENHEAVIQSHDEEQAVTLARVPQNSFKLALIYACSQDAENPRISLSAVRWGYELASYLREDLHEQAGRLIAVSEFDRRQKQVLQWIRQAGGRVTRNAFTRKWQHLTPRERDEILNNLIVTGHVVSETDHTGGRPAEILRLT